MKLTGGHSFFMAWALTALYRLDLHSFCLSGRGKPGSVIRKCYGPLAVAEVFFFGIYLDLQLFRGTITHALPPSCLSPIPSPYPPIYSLSACFAVCICVCLSIKYLCVHSCPCVCVCWSAPVCPFVSLHLFIRPSTYLLFCLRSSTR